MASDDLRLPRMVPLRAPDCIWQRELEEWTDLEGLLYHGSRESRELMRRYEFYLEPELSSSSSSSSSSALRAAPPPLPPAATSLINPMEISPMEIAHAVAAAAYHQQQQQQLPTALIPKPSAPTTAPILKPSVPTTAPVPRPRGRAPSGSTGVPMVWCSNTGRWESL